MRNKALMILLLTLVAGVMLMPVTIRAGGGEEKPLSIAVWLDSGYLHVLAEDENSVAVVYVNQNRVDYTAGGVNVNASDYAESDGKLAVYAADKYGNTSNTVILYITDDPVVSVETPTPTRPPKPLTPDGTGTVMDNAEGGDGKEFFTITTANDNVFYLIIDRQRSNNNVYFLNPVTEQDLLSLADISIEQKQPESIAAPAVTKTITPTEDPETPVLSPTTAPEPEPKTGGLDPRLIIILILIGAGFVAGYYFLVMRPKHQNNKGYQSEDEDIESDSGDDEEIDGGFDYDEDEIPYDKPDTDDEGY